MTSWRRVKKLFKIMMRKIGNPPIRLVTPKKWDELFPDFKFGACYGRCSIENKIMTCRYKDVHSKFQINDTILHEAMHILFRYKPHWWIEGAAMKINNLYVRGHFMRKNHRSMSDIPNIKRLLYLVRYTSERMRQLER